MPETFFFKIYTSPPKEEEAAAKKKKKKKKKKNVGGGLLLDHRAVALPYLSPSAIQIVWAGDERRLGGGLFVDLDSPAGLLADPQVSVFHFGAAVKNLLRPLVER